MERRYYDLRTSFDDPEGSVRYAKNLGWHGVCAARMLDSGFVSYAKKAVESKDEPGTDILLGVIISTDHAADVQKKARSALESGANIILVAGGDEEINRAASECWEVDVLCHPERVTGKDPMDQKNSGVDDVMARFMAERGIAIEICLAELLSCYGVVRAQVMGRMRQNIMLAKKYKTPIIISSGAKDRYGMRTPQDLSSLGITLGMDAGQANKAVSDYPLMLIKKSCDRRGSDVLLTGLEVVSWGTFKGKPNKKMFGWY